MTQQLNAMQESIKIALDAADAATDVTSEYKRIKNEYLKTEQKMKEIHKYTTIIFSSSIAIFKRGSFCLFNSSKTS